LYVRGTDRIAVFRRNGRTGALRQLRGNAGCLSRHRSRRCRLARGLRGGGAIAVSRDGRSVYATGSGGTVVVFARNRRTGALRQLRGRFGSIAGGGLDRPTSLTLSPSGRFLYVGSRPGAVVTFRRNPRSGRLAQLACVNAGGTEGCTRASALAGVADLAIDSEGRNLYAAAGDANAVAVFDRTSGGVPRQLAGSDGCISEGTAGCTPGRTLLGASGLAVRGNQVYAAASFKAAVAVLGRSPAGSLSQPPGAAGCIRDSGSFDCAVGHRMTSPSRIIVSPDGRNAYAATTEDGSVAVFQRDAATGGLSQLPAAAGCLRSPTVPDCGSAGGLQGPLALAASRDGRSVYVVYGESDALALYRRAR
jgi:DNA-binding beta-propeller fold protein YncE